jgi:tRNA-2-methylthio-N6-dimethylallyladenosine synthase
VSFRFLIQTFGCQMNVHDSDRMRAVLRAAGGVAVLAAEDADLVVFNTCSVREKAEQKLRSEVGKLAPLKRARPGLVVAVAGCVAQQEGEALLERNRHVDLVVGPDNIHELPALLHDQMTGAPPLARTVFDTESPRFLSWVPSDEPTLPRGAAPGRQAPVTAFVTTMKGCDERCSFCVVPYTRGPERYRPAREIIGEVRRFVEAGSREVLLLGQTVDSYRDRDLSGVRHASDAPPTEGTDESQFAELLHAIDAQVPAYDRSRPAQPGLARLRYTSPHPRHANAKLAKAHAELDVLARHVHLPVQSGSDRVLRRMIRRYTRADYVARAERLRRARAGLTLSTDIIVGFPGETEEDFQETLSLVREIGFVSLFGFKYSPRPHTPALRLGDDVPEEVKSDRLARLFEVSEAFLSAHLTLLVGTRQSVLVEAASKSEKGDTSQGRVQGRTDRNEIVHVDVQNAANAAAVIGQVVDVEITRANRHSLAGTPVGPLPPAVAPLPDRQERGVPAAAQTSVPGTLGARHLPLVS